MVTTYLLLGKVLARAVLAAIFLIPALVSADTYRYVDQDGIVHYSDRPMEGAETVDLSAAQTFSKSSRPVPTRRPVAKPQQADEPFRYQELKVAQPLNDGSIWNNAGEVRITYQVQPRLRQGDRVRIYMDGEPVENAPFSLSVQLENVERGTHQIRATIEDVTGRVVANSDTSVFHYKQTFIRN